MHLKASWPQLALCLFALFPSWRTDWNRILCYNYRQMCLPRSGWGLLPGASRDERELAVFPAVNGPWREAILNSKLISGEWADLLPVKKDKPHIIQVCLPADYFLNQHLKVSLGLNEASDLQIWKACATTIRWQAEGNLFKPRTASMCHSVSKIQPWFSREPQLHQTCTTVPWKMAGWCHHTGDKPLFSGQSAHHSLNDLTCRLRRAALPLPKGLPRTKRDEEGTSVFKNNCPYKLKMTPNFRRSSVMPFVNTLRSARGKTWQAWPEPHKAPGGQARQALQEGRSLIYRSENSALGRSSGLVWGHTRREASGCRAQTCSPMTFLSPVVLKVWSRELGGGSLPGAGLCAEIFGGSLQGQNHFHNQVYLNWPLSAFFSHECLGNFPETTWYVISQDKIQKQKWESRASKP